MIKNKIQKIAPGQRANDTDCLPEYPYFKEHHKMSRLDLSIHQALDADPKAI